MQGDAHAIMHFFRTELFLTLISRITRFFAGEIKNLIYPAFQFAWRRKKRVLLLIQYFALNFNTFAEIDQKAYFDTGCF